MGRRRDAEAEDGQGEHGENVGKSSVQTEILRRQDLHEYSPGEKIYYGVKYQCKLYVLEGMIGPGHGNLALIICRLNFSLQSG